METRRAVRAAAFSTHESLTPRGADRVRAAASPARSFALNGVTERAYIASVFGLGVPPVHDAVNAFRYLNLVAFTALGVVAVIYWDRHRERAAMWAAATF